MIEVNGKFAKWLKFNGYNPDKIKNITLEDQIDSLDGMSCVEIIRYMESLISVYGKDATYREHWTGYGDSYPVVEVTMEETDEEYEERITSLRKKYDREVFEKRKAIEDERKKLEAQVKNLQEQLNGLEGGL